MKIDFPAPCPVRIMVVISIVIFPTVEVEQPLPTAAAVQPPLLSEDFLAWSVIPGTPLAEFQR